LYKSGHHLEIGNFWNPHCNYQYHCFPPSKIWSFFGCLDWWIVNALSFILCVQGFI